MVTASWGTGARTKVSLQPSSRTHCLAGKLSRWPSQPCGCWMLTLFAILSTMLTTFCSRWHVEAITPSVSPQTGTSSPGVRTTVARSEVGPQLTRGTISGCSCYNVTRAPLLYFISSWVVLSFKVFQLGRPSKTTERIFSPISIFWQNDFPLRG